MAKAKKGTAKKISNRRARHDYELGDSFVVGLQLTGAETKALRLGQAHLQGAYVTVKDGELFLINSTIAGSKGVPIDESEQTRTRKLLAKRREIDNMITAKQQGMTIVPLEMITGSRFIKLKLSVGRGKKRYDKRQTIKKRDENRQINRALKQSR